MSWNTARIAVALLIAAALAGGTAIVATGPRSPPVGAPAGFSH